MVMGSNFIATAASLKMRSRSIAATSMETFSTGAFEASLDATAMLDFLTRTCGAELVVAAGPAGPSSFGSARSVTVKPKPKHNKARKIRELLMLIQMTQNLA